MPEIDGIFVKISGDVRQLRADMTRARAIVKESATDISNQLKNALSPKAVEKGLNSLIRDLGMLNRAAKASGADFKKLTVDLKEVQHVTGLTDRQFQKLQRRMLEQKANYAQEQALKRLVRDMNLNRLEAAKLARQMGLNRKALSTLTGGIGTHIKSLASWHAALGLVAGAAGLGYLVKRNLDALDTLGKVSDKVGFTTGQLQELRFAAEQTGVSSNTLDMALQRFSRRLGEVAQGTGELKNTAKQYGIELTDGAGRMRSNMAIMRDFADVIAGAGSEQEKLRIAFKLFDSEGAALVNLLSRGSKAMDTLRQEARDLGIVLSEEMIRNAEKANDEISKLSRVITVQFQTAVGAAAPHIAKAAQAMTGWVVDLSKALEDLPVARLSLAAQSVGAIAAFMLKDWRAAFKLAKDMPGHLEAIAEEARESDLRRVWGDVTEAAKELAEEAGKTGQAIIKANKEASKELQKAMDTLYEEIQEADETTLETQLRHLDELAKKYKANSTMIVLIEHRKNQLITKMAKGVADEVSDLYAQEVAAAQALGEAEVLSRDATGRKIVEINKSSLQKMLEDWADFSTGWEDIAKNFLENLQSEFATTFKNVFEGAEDAWDGLWESFKNIAYQALAAIAAKLASGLVANIVLSIMPSLGGVLGGGGGGGLNLPSLGGGGGIGGWLTNTLGTGAVGKYGPQIPTLWGVSAQGWNAALGAAGLGMMGGGLMGQFLFGGKGYSNLGGSIGGGLGAGAASLMATAGLLPITGPLAPILGGLLGGLGGGFLGSLFGGDDDSADREADARRFQELAEKLAAGKGDKSTYMDAILAGISSDNRVSGAAMEQVYAMSKAQGLLDWWTPDPGQLGVEERRGYTDDQWKRFQVYGGADEKEMGSMAFMELFGGAGKGGWGGNDNWGTVKNVMEGMDDETIEKLGSSMGTFKDLATEWGVSVQDLLGPLIDADLAGDEWKEALEGLSAATLVQNAADAERAAGLNELAIAQNSVMRSISLMAGWNDMEADGKAELIKQLQKDASKRDELMQASERLREVEEQLTGAHELSEEEVEALAQEYADLTEKLGLNDTAAADAAGAAKDFAKVMMNEVIPALRAALGLTGGDSETSHTGGYFMHTGGPVGMDYPEIRFHSGGLMPDEIPVIAQRGEFMLSRDDVRRLGGAGGVEALRRGGLSQPAPQPITIQVYTTDGRLLKQQVFAAMDRGEGPREPLKVNL